MLGRFAAPDFGVFWQAVYQGQGSDADHFRYLARLSGAAVHEAAILIHCLGRGGFVYQQDWHTNLEEFAEMEGEGFVRYNE